MNIRISYLLIGIISLMLFNSCSDKTATNNLNEVYPINLHQSINPPDSPEEWIDELEFVPLETNPDCFLASRMLYDVSDSHIAVSSNNAVHIFDRHGKHINSFKKEGKGPGEYVLILDIRLMPNTNEIMISDPNSRKIIIYDFNGNTISDIHLNMMMLDVVPVESNILACYMGRMSREYFRDNVPGFDENLSLVEIVFLNRNGQVLSKNLPFKYSISGGFSSGDFSGPIKPGVYLINPAYTYNIYQVGPGENFELKYRFDYLDMGIDTTILEDKKLMNSGSAFSNFQGFKKLDHLKVNENSILLWAPDVDKENMGFRLINRKSGNQRSLFLDSSNTFGKYNGIPIDFVENSSGKWFIQKSEAIDILESLENLSPDQRKALSKAKGFDRLSELKEDDNPVLVFYKVKDF